MLDAAKILTVSQLNRQIKAYLEYEVGMVHVEGEISNLSKPSSGHFYFTLKDANAQVRCAFFKNRQISVMAKSLADGQLVVAKGQLSLYEARGDYQLIIESLTSAGVGDLFKQFETLKNKLAAEGLFDIARKKPIPKMPSVIGVITSATGAAIQDILKTLEKRFPVANVIVYPTEVQGANAHFRIIEALQLAHQHRRADVLILARGGGSIEDLWAFNDEGLARQISSSTIPIVSGVGHETDFTIADFVADLRAETPTAAAAAVTPFMNDLLDTLIHLIARLSHALSKKIQTLQLKLNQLNHKISSPKQAVQSYWQALDYLEKQLTQATLQLLKHNQHAATLLHSRLCAQNPKSRLHIQVNLCALLQNQLIKAMQNKMHACRFELNNNLSTLHAVSPLATLDRGYAIATKQQQVIYSSRELGIGDEISVKLSQGSLQCTVNKIDSEL